MIHFKENNKFSKKIYRSYNINFMVLKYLDIFNVSLKIDIHFIIPKLLSKYFCSITNAASMSPLEPNLSFLLRSISNHEKIAIDYLFLCI